MTVVEQKVDALCRMILGTSEDERSTARANLCKLLGGVSCGNSVEAMVHEYLNEIGVPSALVGHGYIVDALICVVNNPKLINNMTRTGGLYMTVASKKGVTPQIVERGIRHAIEVAWTRGDVDVLSKYFGNTISYNKAKPTNTEFISRIANIIRLRLNP